MLDGHCHLDRQWGNVAKAMEFVMKEAKKVNVQGMILLNVPEIDYENKKVLEQAKDYGKFFYVFPAVNPGSKDCPSQIKGFKKAGASGIKMHPRMQSYRLDTPATKTLLKCAGDCGLPVLIDCFPAGDNIVMNNLPVVFGKLAQQCPQTKIAIGHSGGHHILDALMISKYYKNVYLDLSYTLLYYRGSHVLGDIPYVLKSSKYERIFWGTDYPDRPYAESVRLTLDEFNKMNIPEDKKEALFVKNVENFLGIAC